MLGNLLSNLSNLFKTSGDSGSIAKSRLKLVLVHDRVNCQYDMDIMEALKNDIIQVIKKYMELDGELDIQISNKVNSSNNSNPDNVSVLCANIPIKKMRKVTVN